MSVLIGGTLLGGAFGTIIGSFLNVVVFRVPLDRSVASPPSACTGCGQAIRARDNVPVLSWILLRGRCRDCRATISPRYPLVELGTGAFFAVVTWSALAWFIPAHAGGGVSTASIIGFVAGVVAYLYLAAVSVALALIDIDSHTLPNKIVLPAYAVGFGLLGASSLLFADYGALFRAVIGLAVLWLVYFLMAVLYPGGMGFGDVKLAGVLGMFLGWLGWGQLVVGAFSAFLLGGLFALVLLISRRVGRKGGIPFGPWMLIGAWLGIFVGDKVWSSYLGLFGLA